LKVLGFVNGQVVSAVVWQATTVALVGSRRRPSRDGDRSGNMGRVQRQPGCCAGCGGADRPNRWTGGRHPWS